MEHEENRVGRRKEEAEDECGSDTSAERSVLSSRLSLPWQPCSFGPLHVDLTELDLPSTMRTHFEDPTDLLNFILFITPDEGQHLRF